MTAPAPASWDDEGGPNPGLPAFAEVYGAYDRPDNPVGAVTIDAITDALMIARDATARAEILCALVAEVYACTIWLHDTCGPGELGGLQELLEAAEHHRQRMRGPAASAELGG